MANIVIGEHQIVVDNDMYPILDKYKWCILKNKKINYAQAKIGRKNILMHHFVIGHPVNNLVTDHINGNGLDNRKENLRVVTHRENCQNRHDKRSSEYPGVYWHKRRKKYCSSIMLNGSIVHLSSFNTEKDASIVYYVADFIVDVFDNINSIFLQKAVGVYRHKSSAFKGVSYDKRERKWYASIKINSKQINLGLFKKETDAARAFQIASQIDHDNLSTLRQRTKETLNL